MYTFIGFLNLILNDYFCAFHCESEIFKGIGDKI